VAAYYNGVTNYVVMYEQSKLGEIAPELALKQAVSTVAHEGVHQILHNIGVQQRLSRWPMWISEGLPEYFAPTDVARGVRWKGLGLVNDLRFYSLKEFFKNRGPAGEPGAVVRDTVAARQLTADGYAAAWALTFYLSKLKADDFFAYLREVSQIGPLEESSTDHVAVFNQHFGSDYAALEDAMLKYLQKQPYVDPVENQTHYVAMVTTNLRRSVMITTSPASIGKWQQDLATEFSAAERNTARLQVQGFPNRSAAETYAVKWLNGS
jgi:hypothetical protein